MEERAIQRFVHAANGRLGVAAAGFLMTFATTPAPAETPSWKPDAAVSSFSGSGSAFPYPVYVRWADAYRKETGVALNYQAIGSGGGIKQILAKAVTFGDTDVPLSGDRLGKEDVAQFPTLLGGLVAVVNLDGVGPGDLTLDGPTLAGIFLGDIRKWNDAAIVRLNPSLKLPPDDIVVVHRGDGASTTFVWTAYLSEVSPEWKSKVGSGPYVNWPVGLAVKGIENLSGVSQFKNGITYTPFENAKLNRMAYVKLVNRDGRTVAPDLQSLQAAAANAGWASAPGFGLLLTNQPGAASWPIVYATFALMPKNAPNAGEAAAALAFFNWGYGKGRAMAEEYDYGTLPPGLIAMVRKSWREIMVGGKPVFSAD